MQYVWSALQIHAAGVISWIRVYMYSTNFITEAKNVNPDQSTIGVGWEDKLVLIELLLI